MGDTARDAFRNSWQKGTRTFNEGLEVLSGRLGSLGNLVHLPEDELATIREASRELERLVPLLALAIQVHNQRGQKRAYSHDCLPSRAQVPKLLDAPSSETLRTSQASFSLSAKEVPELHMQLVSDHPSARSGTPLPVLNTREMRLREGSSSSIESSPKHHISMDDRDELRVCRLSFGRLEVKDKAPVSITVTSKGNMAPQPILRFVSRELFVLEVPAAPLAMPPCDSMGGATLQMGCEGDDLSFATLAFGSDDIAPSAPEPLAFAIGVSQNGLHLRKAGQQRWCWIAKDVKADLREGDCIAVLLESPPGSSQCGPPKDLEEKDVTCLLGLELKRPQGD